MKKKFATLAAIGLLCALVTGCGGGGGGSSGSSDDSPSAPTSNPQGFWSGTTSDGVGINLIVLDTGETYGYYAARTSNGFDGALLGDVAFSNNQLSGSWLNFPFTSQSVHSGSYTGNFVAQDRLALQFPTGVTYSASYNVGYDDPPTPISTVAGNYSSGIAAIGWKGFASSELLPKPASAVVSASGAITFSPMQRCIASGTIKPRASGKNIYDAVINLQGSGCYMAFYSSVTLRGIALYVPGAGTSGALLIEARDDAKTGGLFFLAGK